MKIQILSASVVRSFRSLSVALPIAALLCAAPLTRSARADNAPKHIYLFDAIFGLTDVTSTYDGSSVISITGDVIYVSIITGAGGHTTDITGAGGHTTDSSPNDPSSIITGAGGHTTDLVLDDANVLVGIAAP